MKTEKELTKMRDDLKAQLKEVKRYIKEAKSKPADGWRISESSSYTCYFENGILKFGISGSGEWVECNDFPINLNEVVGNIRLATPEEVTQRLTEFVNGLGYIVGAKVESHFNGNKYTLNDTPLRFETIALNETNFVITLGGLIIWDSKKGFAKIIEEPKFKVEIIRTEKSGSTTIEISHGSDVDSDQLLKEIETVLNSKS